MTLAPFVQTGNGVHPTIDFERLRAQYPDLPADVWNIGSASDLLGWEAMRTRYGITAPDAIPCDLFVWGTGEPPDRRLTRVGGVPWLPKRTPWPIIGNKVTTFLCQFDFRDSKDLDGQLAGESLPGDLLLVFVAGKDSALTADEEELRFVWVSAQETEVYTRNDAPDATDPFDFVTTWGVRYRSEDIPSQWDKAYDIPEDAGSGRLWCLPVLWGTKIGGVPYNSQENQYEPPSNYLCQLVSIQASGTRWPWVDAEEPLDPGFGCDGIHGDKQCLMIGDMGELTLFMRDDGTVTADSACG
ncbi:MAG: DUF1963 domain-containing protein [Patescibacteria group bacterium]|nr:DUF1963 domain-containing protein [Patescibacteria group bacterium]